MDWARCRKLMWRWSLLTAALITAFWGIWSIFAPVPVVDSIQITREYFLPLHMSHWWDVLIGPICSVMIIGTCYVIRYLWARDPVLGCGLVFALVFFPALMLVGGQDSPSFALVVGLVFALTYGLTYGLVLALVMIVKYIASRNFWTAIGNWLLPKN